MTNLDDVLKRALAARQQGRDAESLALYEEAARMAPQLPLIRVEIAHQFDLLGQSAEAEALNRALLAELPGNARPHRGIGKACRDTGRIAEAIAHYREAVALEPSVYWIVLELLRLLKAERRLDEAEAVLKELASRLPRSAYPWVELARLARERGQDDDVRPALMIALLREPQSLDALGLLMMDERQHGAEEVALAACRRILDVEPRHPYAPLVEAAYHRESRRFAEADAVLSRALDMNPGHRAQRLNLAKVKRELEQPGAARELLLGLFSEAPDDAEVLEELALLELNAGQTEEGAGYVARLLQTGKASAVAPVALARHYMALHRYDEARAFLRTSVAQVTSPATLYVEWATLEAQGGDMATAFDLAEKALALEPGNADGTILKGRLLFETGRPAEGVALLEGMAGVLGAQPDYYARLGQLHLQLGSIARSAALLEEGRRRHPRDFGILNQWLATAMRCGRLDDVRREIAACRPQNAEQARQLAIMAAQAKRAAGEYQDAYRDLDRLTKEAGMPPYVDVEAARAAIPLLDAKAARSHLQAYFSATAGDPENRGRRHNVSQDLLGQIADEFLLDAEAIAKAREASLLPEGERLPALLRAVRDYPEQTGCAIALLAELRRAGWFEARRSPGTAGPALIPRRIFQYWDSPDVPDDIAGYCRSWRDFNPGYDYILFNRDTAREYLKQHAGEKTQRAFRRIRLAAGRADILRLSVLAVEGGIYCDADDRCLGPLDAVSGGGTRLAAVQEDIGSLGNNFLASAPSHPVIARALENASASLAAGANDSIWLSTGPGQLSRSFAQILAAAGAGWPQLLEPVSIFNWTGVSGFCAAHCFADYKNTSAHWSRLSKAASNDRSNQTAGMPSDS